MKINALNENMGTENTEGKKYGHYEKTQKAKRHIGRLCGRQ
jgi:hypothetical protein